MRDICSPCGRDVPSYASEGASSQACGWSFASYTDYTEGVSLGLAGPSARAPIHPGPEGRAFRRYPGKHEPTMALVSFISSNRLLQARGLRPWSSRSRCVHIRMSAAYGLRSHRHRGRAATCMLDRLRYTFACGSDGYGKRAGGSGTSRGPRPVWSEPKRTGQAQRCSTTRDLRVRTWSQATNARVPVHAGT